MYFYTREKLGPTRSKTPEGYLLCERVPIARTGHMIYGAEELSDESGKPVITPSESGVIKIFRKPEEVFREETVASFNGKSVTNDHPEEGEVSPETWKELSCGVVMNVRQGTGDEDDLLFGDLLITDPQSIQDVEDGKREVSCGYSADYVETAKGEGYQKNIVGNHVALVEAGRCGWRCAIGDRQYQPQPKEKHMAKKSWKQQVLDAFHSKDEEGLQQVLAEKTMDDPLNPDEDGDTHIHVHTGGAAAEPIIPQNDEGGDLSEQIAQLSAQFSAFEERIAALEAAAQGTGDELDPDQEELVEAIKDELPAEADPVEVIKANDAAVFADSFADTLAMAEIIAPGIRLPAFDAKAGVKKSFKDMCGLRRKALDGAYKDQDSKPVIDEILGGRTLDTASMTCGAVRTLFRSVGAARRQMNNDANRGSGRAGDNSGSGAAPATRSVKDLNKEADKYWLK